MKGKKTKTNKQQSKIIKKGKNKTKRTRSKKGGGDSGATSNNIAGQEKRAIINVAANGETNLDYAKRLQNEMNKSQPQKKANYQYNNETEEKNGLTPPAIATNGPPEPKAMGGAGGPILVIGLLGGLIAILASQ